MTLEEGMVLFREGDAGKDLYVVRSGELRGTNTLNGEVNVYGPGALIGEMGLLKSEPCTETVTATEDSELQVINQETLNETLEKEPAWFKSILHFLTGRLTIAQTNKRKSDKIKALPSLLYELIAQAKKGDNVPTAEIIYSEQALFNISAEDILELLKILEELDILKIQGNNLRCKNVHVAALLYETICYRAIHKKMAPQILSMTDQMVLSAVIKTVQQSKEPLKNGMFTVNTADLIRVSHRALFGVTLTTRTLLPLLRRKLLNSSAEINEDCLPELETIPFFFGDFDTILDLMELNRIYPLLDKKLI